MHTRTKLVLAALTAALAMGLVSGTAAALRSLSIEGPTTLTLNARAISFKAGEVEVICETTLVKTVSRQIPKTEGVLIGRITEVIVNVPTCSGGLGVTRVRNVTILGTAEATGWRLFYKSIGGTLPRIREATIRIENSQTLFEVETIFGNVNCLYRGFIEGSAAVNETTGVVGKLRSIRREELRLTGTLSSALCERTGGFTATGANGELVPLQTTTLRLL